MESLNLHLITYNVATNTPDGVNSFASTFPNGTKPDLVLVGFQEVNSQPQTILLDAVLTGDDPWTQAVRSQLAPLGYVKVRSIRLVGLVLSLFALDTHLPYLRSLETQYTRLGFAGYWGSKGTVSIRFSIYGVSVCVLNSHLAAHDHNQQARIEGYNTVLGSHTYANKDTELILYHDYVFWMGDLNFRLQEDSYTFEQIDMLINKKELSKLLAVDQLSAVRNSGEAFSELDERLPTFPPTFKYKVGSLDVLDGKRRPAWTDRILHRVNTTNYDKYKLNLSQHSYQSHPEFLLSDHKPVSSSFTLSVFSAAVARDELLLTGYAPVVRFFPPQVPRGPHEDLVVVYEVRPGDRRLLSAWDWIGLYRATTANLEQHIAFTWAPASTVRDGVYEVVFDDALYLRPDNYLLVYYSAGSGSILGVSSVFSVSFPELEPELAEEAREEL